MVLNISLVTKNGKIVMYCLTSNEWILQWTLNIKLHSLRIYDEKYIKAKVR